VCVGVCVCAFVLCFRNEANHSRALKNLQLETYVCGQNKWDCCRPMQTV